MINFNARLIFLLALILVYAPALSSKLAQSAIIINSGANEALVADDESGFYNQIVKEAFKRLGINAETIRLPSERALLNANQGLDDGNIARIKNIEKKYTNLVRVPVRIIDFEFLVYSNIPDLKIRDWQSLAPYHVGIITGWKILEKNITKSKSLTKVRTTRQLFELLAYSRVDLVVFDRWGGLLWKKLNRYKFHIIEPPLAKREMFIYLNKKHKNLVPKLTKALMAMKEDGTYQAILEKTLLPLQQYR